MAELRAWDDLDLNGAECEDELEELEQDAYHRLIETPGSNPDDPDRGLGLEERVSGVVDLSLGHEIEAELRKDDRIDAVTARVTVLTNGNAGATVDVQIEITVGASVLSLHVVRDAQGLRRIS